MKNVVFLTGATGFLGTQIVRRLIKKEDCSIIILVRGSDDSSAKRHLARAWWEWPELLELMEEECKGPDKSSKTSRKETLRLDDKKIQLVRGDISKEKLGLEKGLYEDLAGKVTHIIHAAADLRLNAPMEELRRINVQGTRNVLKLGEEAHLNHVLQRFSHISTAYVAGGRKGSIEEDSLTDKYGFLSNYERSKFEGELEVKKSNLPVSVFRPGMVVGDSKTGFVKTFNTVYTILRIYLKGNMRIIPVSPSLKINMVPVDYVADAVTDLTFNPNAENQNFHLTAPIESLPSVKELVDFINT